MPLPPARTDGLRVEQTLPCGDGGGARQRGLAGPWRGRSGRRQRVPLDWQTAAAPFPGMTSEAAGAWAGSEWRKGGRQEGYCTVGSRPPDGCYAKCQLRARKQLRG